MRRAARCHVLTFGAALLVASAAATAQPPQDPDWPCIQRLVPEVSAGMVWAGPPVGAAGDWRDDAGIGELAAKLASRRVPIGQAETALEAFARTLGDDKAALLARLDADGKVEFPVEVELTDADGNTVASMTVHWHVRKNA